MIPLACILLLAATRVELVDEPYTIPANQWRYVELGLNQRPAQVSARFEVKEGGGRVRLALMPRSELRKLRDGLPQGVITMTSLAQVGTFSNHVGGTGEYVVVVDNRSASASVVHLKIWLDFGAIKRGPDVTRLSPQRQLVVILISFAVFFGIVTWSARKLLRGIRRAGERVGER